MDSKTVRQIVTPFYPLLAHAFETAWLDAMASIMIIKSVRKQERATILHATIRESLREACDACDPFLVMTEEPEGRGLDALRLTLDDQVIALRWGRFDQVRNLINRNESGRSIDMHQQQFLFGDHFDPKGLPTATVTYQIDNDSVEVGVPQWWMSRIALRRERVDSTEFIEEIVSYKAPIRFADLADPRTPQFISTRQNRRDAMEKLGDNLRRKLG
jgi:hypothetical protein